MVFIQEKWLPALSVRVISCGKLTWKRSLSVSRRADYAGLARVFAELADKQEIWLRQLEGWNVEGSQVVKEWQDQARAEGEARGRAEGLQFVRARLLRFLQVRFPNELPADQVAALQAVESIETRDRCFDAALTAASLAEVQNALQQP